MGTALEYHEATKHSSVSVRTNPHFMDWSIKPTLYKDYPRLEAMALARDFPLPVRGVFECLKPCRGGQVDAKHLASLLFYSAGVTKRVRLADGSFHHFRAAPCTGALYHIEAYAVAGDVPGLPAGVYHFDPLSFALRPLRRGDHRAHLAEAVADEGAGRSPLLLVLTSVFWRNAWKYQARCYRHAYWDSGVLLAQLLASASALGLRCRVLAGFVDGRVNDLLGVDGRREAALEVVALGEPSPERPGGPPILSPLPRDGLPPPGREVGYPLLEKAHRASALAAPDDVQAWRAPLVRPPLPPAGPPVPLPPPATSSASLQEGVLRRGSARSFAHKPVSPAQLAALLSALWAPVDADFLSGDSLVDAYLIAHAVEPLEPGVYFCRGPLGGASASLERVKAGNFRGWTGHLCLDQPLGSDASLAFFFMADLERVLTHFGDRGYRAAQLEAGIRGGNLYLGAYGLGLGASGITFYDDEVTDFLGPHAHGKSCMFSVMVGHPAYQKVRYEVLSPGGAQSER